MKRPEDDHWCAKHECTKTWLITTSFCPVCEKEKQSDSFNIPDPKLLKKSLQTAWKEKYGRFIDLSVKPHAIADIYYVMCRTTNYSLNGNISKVWYDGQEKQNWPGEWKDWIAEIWKV